MQSIQQTDKTKSCSLIEDKIFEDDFADILVNYHNLKFIYNLTCYEWATFSVSYGPTFAWGQ